MQNRTRGRKLAWLAGLTVLAILMSMAWIFQQDLRGWYQLYKHFDRLGLNAQGYQEYRHTRGGIVFVRLPGGEFLMGAGERDGRPWDEQPRHLVRLSPFLIAKYEVSQREWPERPRAANLGDDQPVFDMNWDACRAFCEDRGLRLPSEAQWEYAARAGARGGAGGGASLGAAARPGNATSRFPGPVGRSEPNGFGLHDLFGNVWEWCEDFYNESFYASPEAAGPDPVCSRGLNFHVLRGGSWRSPAAWRRAGFRATGTMALEECGLRPVWMFPKE